MLRNHYRNRSGGSKVMTQPLEPKVDFSRSEFRPTFTAPKVRLVLPLSFLCLLGE